MSGVGGVQPGGLPNAVNPWPGLLPGLNANQPVALPGQQPGQRPPADGANLAGNQRAAALQLGNPPAGQESDEAFVKRMYRELLGREPEKGGFDHHMKLLGQGMSREQMWAAVSVSEERRMKMANAGGQRPPGAEGLPDPNGLAANPNLEGGAQRPRDGGGGFLWKPISDSTGKLAILFPPKYSGSLVSCELFGPNGQSLGKGSDGGVGNGDRQHYRFPKPGGQYPAGTTVVGTLANGEKITYTIDRPGSRID